MGAACALLAATDAPNAPESLKADATTALRVLAAAGHPHRALVLRQAAARVGVAAAAGRTVNGYVGERDSLRGRVDCGRWRGKGWGQAGCCMAVIAPHCGLEDLNVLRWGDGALRC